MAWPSSNPRHAKSLRATNLPWAADVTAVTTRCYARCADPPVFRQSAAPLPKACATLPENDGFCIRHPVRKADTGPLQSRQKSSDHSPTSRRPPSSDRAPALREPPTVGIFQPGSKPHRIALGSCQASILGRWTTVVISQGGRSLSRLPARPGAPSAKRNTLSPDFATLSWDRRTGRPTLRETAISRLFFTASKAAA